MPVSTRTSHRRQSTRRLQPRRPSLHTTRHLEPPDYSRDYADVRRDLTLIAIISSLLFIGVVGLSFVI